MSNQTVCSECNNRYVTLKLHKRFGNKKNNVNMCSYFSFVKVCVNSEEHQSGKMKMLLLESDGIELTTTP